MTKYEHFFKLQKNTQFENKLTCIGQLRYNTSYLMLPVRIKHRGFIICYVPIVDSQLFNGFHPD